MVSPCRGRLATTMWGAVGVIPDPIVTRHVVGPDDEFLVIFSDGVGNAIKSKETVSIVGMKLREGATAASRVLIQEAALTIIVVVLSNLWEKDGISIAAPVESNKETVSSTVSVTEIQKSPKHIDDSVKEKDQFAPLQKKQNAVHSSESLVDSGPLTRSKATLFTGPPTRSHCTTN